MFAVRILMLPYVDKRRNADCDLQNTVDPNSAKICPAWIRLYA